jgi:hypothetical protein
VEATPTPAGPTATPGGATATPADATATPANGDIVVTGLVYAAAAGRTRPIAGATVYVGVSVPRQPFSAVTGADGRYSLLVPALYANLVNRIGATAAGYAGQELAVTAGELAAQPVRDFGLAAAARTPTAPPERPGVYLPVLVDRAALAGRR